MFVIRNLVASRVNLITNDYVAGLPSPLSFLGLVDMAVRHMGLAPWSGRCLPVLHEVSPSIGRTKAEMQAKSGSFGPVEIVEDLHGRVKVSLIVDIPGADRAGLAAAIAGRRIAGGVIENRDVDVAEAVGGKLFSMISRGYAVVPPTSEAKREVFDGTLKSLNTLARTVFPTSRSPGDGWLVPTAVGYRLLEDPATVEKRRNTRNPAVPHVFVEPLAGIAELISVRKKQLTELDADAISALLWGWKTQDNLVLGNAAYLPR